MILVFWVRDQFPSEANGRSRVKGRRSERVKERPLVVSTFEMRRRAPTVALCNAQGSLLRAGGGLAVWCYAKAEVTPAVDAVVEELYEGFLGAFWEPERRLVEKRYGDVTFPFPELAAPPFELRASWRLEQLVGYLGTWSALA